MSGAFLGPWFCSLFFNTANKCKKKTHLEAHTYPHLAADALNKTLFNTNGKRIKEKEDGYHCWIIVLKVGPFNRLHHAQNFLRLWSHKTRGKCIRVSRGVDLFKQYQVEYNLKLWVQRSTQDQAVNSFFSQEEVSDDIIPWREEEEEEEKKEEEEEYKTMPIAFQEGCLEELTIGGIEELLNVSEKQKPKKKIKRTIKL
jgi:hypothetical protein